MNANKPDPFEDCLSGQPLAGAPPHLRQQILGAAARNPGGRGRTAAFDRFWSTFPVFRVLGAVWTLALLAFHSDHWLNGPARKASAPISVAQQAAARRQRVEILELSDIEIHAAAERPESGLGPHTPFQPTPRSEIRQQGAATFGLIVPWRPEIVS